MRPKEKLVPGGILERVSGDSFLFFTGGNKTSDFLVDGLMLWYNQKKPELEGIKSLVINMDNGPECSSRRTQFLLRMVEFADYTGLTIRIVYYPPYHSKYNAIERYWAGLEKSWNGYFLDSVKAVVNRAGNFVWKGMKAATSIIGKHYEKGVKVFGEEKKNYEQRLHRHPELPWWDITIYPERVCL